MSLTKEDLQAIKGIVDKSVEERIQPMKEAVKQVLRSQIELVEKVDYLNTQSSIIIRHLELPKESREMRSTLFKLD